MSSIQRTLNENVLLKAAVADLGIQVGGFVISWITNSEKHYDLTGSSTFLYLSWATLMWAKSGNKLFPRQIAQNSCVTVWALRLGTYLFSRVLKAGEDRRFRAAKKSPPLMLTFWVMQAAWVWITLWPTMIINTKQVDLPLTHRDYIGYGLFATGFLFEMIADYQKTQFRSIPENQGKFISSGLWSLSRHPNYFGEILLWAGLYLPASNVISGKEWYSIISPLFVAGLIIKVSGIPLLEKYADKKWGSLVEYQKYKASTAKLIPFVW